MNLSGIAKLTVLVLLIVGTSVSSGCIDLQTSKRIFFPQEDEEISYIQGTIAEIRHNFTGGLGPGNFKVGTQEEQYSIDNFYIGKGGGDLYIWAQVHFGADTERRVDYIRTIEVGLYYIKENGDPVLKAHKTYQAPPTGRFDKAEMMEQIIGAEEGFWSLRVIGNGTASSSADVPFYDWYQVSVNGRYSTESYNHNAPHSTRDE